MKSLADKAQLIALGIFLLVMSTLFAIVGIAAAIVGGVLGLSRLGTETIFRHSVAGIDRLRKIGEGVMTRKAASQKRELDERARRAGMP